MASNLLAMEACLISLAFLGGVEWLDEGLRLRIVFFGGSRSHVLVHLGDEAPVT